MLAMLRAGAARREPSRTSMVRGSDLGRGMISESVITCPHCGTFKIETMPTDACQVFYECSSCKTLLRPKQGDCCVFCSYGSVPCPPVQEAATGRCAD
jgi:hypothetical protein